MTVGINNLYISGSPFSMSFVSASISPADCSASGPGATAATAGDLTTFQVDAVDEFGNTVTNCNKSISWTGNLTSNGNFAYNVTNVDCLNGVYNFQYNATKAATYQLNVYAGSIGIKTNGNNLVVSAQSQISASHIQASGSGLVNATAGAPASITLVPYDEFGNQITTCISQKDYSDFGFFFTGQTNRSAVCSAGVTGCDPSTGILQATYYCYKAQTYDLYITYLSQTINDDPFTPQVYPGPINGPSTIATGEGLYKAYAGVPAEIYLDAYDQYDNKITTCQESPTYMIYVYATQSNLHVDGTITNCSKGLYIGSYTIKTISASYLVQINYDDNAVAQSPYAIMTYPGPPVEKGCNVTGPGLAGSDAGEYGLFQTYCYDEYNNPITTCAVENWRVNLVREVDHSTVLGLAYDCSNSTTKNPAVTHFRYNATLSGLYDLTLNYVATNVNNQVKTATPNIVAGSVDPDNTAAFGPGLTGQNLVVGETTTFNISARDVFGNNITTCTSVNSSLLVIRFTPSLQPYANANFTSCNNGFYNFIYTSTVATSYSIFISYDGVPVIGSTFSVTFVAGALSATTITASGSGLTQATAGASAPVSMKGYDEYGNQVLSCSSSVYSLFQISLSGPAIVEGSVTNCFSGTYYGSYNATVSGNYNLIISYDNKQISGNPFSPVVSPASVHDSLSMASGNGFGTAGTVTVGTTANVTIQAIDSFGNTIVICNLPRTYWTVQVIAAKVSITKTMWESCSNGVYLLSYNNTVATTVQVRVYGTSSGDQVRNSPKDVFFAAGSLDSDNTYVIPFTNQVAGQLVNFFIQSQDTFRNNITACPIGMNFTTTWTVYAGIYTGEVVSCLQGVFTAQLMVPVQGLFSVNVLYTSSLNVSNEIGNSPFWANFLAGDITADNSIAFGDGVNATTNNNIAGQITSFSVAIYNQYDVPIANEAICLMHLQDNFTFDFTPYFSYDPNDTIYFYGCDLGVFTWYYVPTVAGLLQVDIRLYDEEINGSPYTVHVLPGPIDVNATQVILGNNGTSPFPDNGTFGLQTKDIYGNNLINTSNDFLVRFSPFCAESNIKATGQEDQGIIYYSYSVNVGGTYCIVVEYNGTTIEVPETTLVIVGGMACDNHCSSQGYCFQDYSPSTAGTNYSCSCFQGWVGDDCSTDFNSEYPLTVGAIVGLVIGLGILMFIIGGLIGYFVAKKMNHHHHNYDLMNDQQHDH